MSDIRYQRAEIRKIYSLSSVVFCSLLSVLCLLPSVCFAGDINSRFYIANSLYEQGSFDEAIRQYNTILEQGFESGNLYYNLGNCFFKKGELGKALLNYEKSRRFIPYDKDLAANYEYGCSLIKASPIEPRVSLPVRVLDIFFNNFTVDGLTIMLSALYILILVAILTGVFVRPLKKYAFILAVFIGLFFIACFIGLGHKIALLDREAIVTAQQVEVRFEPFDEATTYFTLPEGSKIIILDKRGDWRKVKRPDGRFGWIKAVALEII